MAQGLSLASAACFVLGAVMLRTPSPLLLALVPAQFALGLAALLAPGGQRWPRALAAALLTANYAFLFKQTFLN